MNIKDTLQTAAQKFGGLNLENPNLEAQLLLGFVLDKPRAWLLAHGEYTLATREEKHWQKVLARRLLGEPLAYITGHREFFGLDFTVNKHTLIPRPETELMVEEIIKDWQKNSDNNLVVDIGTGSGCIITSLVNSLPKNNQFFGLDISIPALKVAQANAKKLSKEKVIFHNSNLLNYLLRHHALLSGVQNLIIAANLPYVPAADMKDLSHPDKQGLAFEPLNALVGGTDGMDYYRELFEQINIIKRHYPDLAVTVYGEIQPGQAELSYDIFGSKTIIKKDLADKDRLFIVKI